MKKLITLLPIMLWIFNCNPFAGGTDDGNNLSRMVGWLNMNTKKQAEPKLKIVGNLKDSNSKSLPNTVLSITSSGISTNLNVRESTTKSLRFVDYSLLPNKLKGTILQTFDDDTSVYQYELFWKNTSLKKLTIFNSFQKNSNRLEYFLNEIDKPEDADQIWVMKYDATGSVVQGISTPIIDAVDGAITDENGNFTLYCEHSKSYSIQVLDKLNDYGNFTVDLSSAKSASDLSKIEEEAKNNGTSSFVQKYIKVGSGVSLEIQDVVYNGTIVPSYTLGGTVTGLNAGTLVLQNNSGDNLTISANGSFVFNTSVKKDTAYNVTVLQQPVSHTCTVSNGTGTATGNVNNINVTCVYDQTVPSITINPIAIPYISSNTGAINSQQVAWSSNRNGSYSIRLGGVDCTTGVVQTNGTATAGSSNTVTMNATSLTVGTNILRVCVVDSISSQTGSNTFTLTRDDTLPTVTATPDAYSSATAINVTLACNDASSGCDKIAYTSNGTNPTMDGTGTITNGTQYSSAITPPNNATTTYKYIARDNAGNVSIVVSSTYTVDSTVATVSVNTVTPVSTIVNGTTDPVISWNASKAGAYTFRVGGSNCSDGTLATGTSVSGSYTSGDISTTINNSVLSSGVNAIRICVENLVGNFGNTTQSITKDTSAPVVGSSGTITTANVTSSGLTLNWTKATDSVTAQASLQYKVLQSLSNNISTVATAEANGTIVQNWATDIATVNVTGLSANTTYYFNVLVKDGVGNKSVYTMMSQATTPLVNAPLKVADTGQTVCSNDTTTITCGTSHNGQDAQYVNKPVARSYTGPILVGASDYITTDNVTGLVWKTCSEGQSGATCGTGTATDYDWTGATSACTALNSANSGAGYANRTDWHLPSIKELRTLPNYGALSPAVDTSYFPGTPNANYWSSTGYTGTANNYFYLNFQYGSDSYSLNTTSTYKARCVSGSIENTQSFTDNGNGTITDNQTGLIWQKCSRGQTNDATCSGSATTATWATALAYCENLELPTGGTDWRLPNVNELKSIIDNSRTNPSINNLFPNTVASVYWSSSTLVYGTNGAWNVHFGNGGANDNGKTANGVYVRCVRGL